MSERARRLLRYGWRPADPPRRPVLFVNPASGGGKAARAALADRARERGIGVTVLRPDRSLSSLVGEAVEGGADALGIAGGDGSLAIVAAAARAHGLPFVCVPAGTRNHFALDLGVDRHDLVGALEAFTDGVERLIDVGSVNGRLFLNNVSLGIYGEAVRQSAYRDAKARTLFETARQVLGPSAASPELRLVDDLGHEHRHPRGRARIEQPVRARSSGGAGHAAEARRRPPRGRRHRRAWHQPAARASVDGDVCRGGWAGAGARRYRRRSGRPQHAARLRDPARRAPRDGSPPATRACPRRACFRDGADRRIRRAAADRYSGCSRTRRVFTCSFAGGRTLPSGPWLMPKRR